MKQFTVLLIEDRPAQATLITDVLDSRRLKVHTAPSPTVALREVAEAQFDVILLDLNLEREEKNRSKKIEYNGIALGQKIREQQPYAAIFMYSSMIEKDREKEFVRYPECVRVQDVQVISSSDLTSVSPDTLYDLLADAVSRMQEKRQQGFPITYSTDLGTKALLEAFAVAEVSELVREAASGLTEVKITALKPGYSGSAIVRLQGSTGMRSSVRRILKITRSKEMVDDEFSRRPEMGTHLDRHSYGPHGRVISAGKLYGIVIPDAVGFGSLAEFLSRPGLTAGEKKQLRAVVEVLLVGPAQDSMVLDEQKLAGDDYKLKAGAAYALEEFLVEAGTWKRVLDGKHRQIIGSVRKFLGTVTDGYKPFRRDGSHVAHLHGDFHCNNVFLASAGEPILIDFGRTGVFPRLFDFAALEVDLLLARMNTGDGAALSFRDISAWSKRAQRAYPYMPLDEIPKERALKADYLRSQVHLGLKRLNNVQPSEYAEVLLFNLLRYLRFPSVTIPKKIFACHLIHQLVDTFHRARVKQVRR